MKTIRTRTGLIVIISFAIIAFSLSFLLSKLPRDTHWQRYRNEYPEKAIQANLRQVVLAARAYFLRSHGANEATYEDLLRDGRLIDRPIEPVQGEDYHTIRLSPTDSRVEVTTRSGKKVTYEFGSLGIGRISPGSFAPPMMHGDLIRGNGGQ